MFYVKSIPITAAMLDAATTVPEDPTPAWTSGTYAVGDERHVVATHTVYRCAIAGSSTVSPELDPTRWQARRPTNRMAAFDALTSTQSISTTQDLVWAINGVRFCNAVDLHALEGATYEIEVRETAGGALIANRTGRLRAQPKGLYDYLFGRRRPVRRVRVTGLPIRPAAQVTVRIKAAAGATRAVGMIALGKFRSLLARAEWGGAEYGAKAEPYNYSRMTTTDGVTSIVSGPKAVNLRFTVMLPRHVANEALEEIKGLMDEPLSISATDAIGYEGLATFGLIRSAPVSYDGPEHNTIEFDVMGLT